MVDEEAKKAAEGRTSRPQDLPAYLRGHPLPKSAAAIKQAYIAKLKSEWVERWKTLRRYQRMKHIDSSLPLGKYTKLSGSLCRAQNSMLMYLPTGHAPTKSPSA